MSVRVPAFAMALLVATVAHAAGPTVLLVPSVSLDPQVPAPLPAKLDELLASALAARPDVKLLAPPAPASTGAGALAPLPEAHQALAQARAAYIAFKFADAARDFARAASLVEDAAVPPAEADTLQAALIEAAMAHAASNLPDLAREDCARLLRLRPRYVIDRVRVPPPVVRLCEAERQAQARVGARPVSLTSTPPLAQAIVDGAPRGTTPLTVELAPGRHWWIVTREDRQPVRRAFEVPAEGQAAPLGVELPDDAVGGLERALRTALSRRGPLPEALDTAARLGAAVPAELVVVAGLDRGPADGWLFTTVAVDVAGRRVARVVVTALDASLANAAQAAAEAAGRLVTSAADEPTLVVSGDGAARARIEALDFHRALFGAAPPRATVAVTASGVATERPEPHRARRWVWWVVGAAAVAVAGGTAAGLAVGLRSNGTQPDQWLIHVPAR